MRKAYNLVRGVGYVCGITAVLMIMWGGRGDPGSGPGMAQIGYLLLVVMFVLFSVSYVLYAMMRR